MKKELGYPVLFSIAIAFIIESIFGYQTSPFYFEPCCGDSAVFYTVGRWWADGFLPYVDVWDQKGPIIHFVNMIGYMFSGSQHGLFFIQWFCLSISLFFVFKFFRLEFSLKSSYFLTAITAIGYTTLYIGGNTVEEYLSPFLIPAFFIIYKWVNNFISGDETKLSLGSTILFGLVFGFSLLTRLTNAIGICTAVGIIAITLILRKRWQEFFRDMIGFFLGFLIIFLPFAIYFKSKSALDEMWYGTFLYNLEYAGSSGFNVLSLKGIANLVIKFIDSYLLLFITLILLFVNKERRFASIFWFIVSFITFTWFVKSNGFANYAIVCLPYVCIAFNELHKLYKQKQNKISSNILKTTLIYYTIIAFVGSAYTIKLFSSLYLKNTDLQVYRKMLKDLPSDYKDSFIGYNCNSDLYQYEDIKPAYPYFVLQDYQTKVGGSLLDRVRNSFNSGKSKYLLVKGINTTIEDIIEKKYDLLKRDEEHHLRLYALK